MRIFYSNQARHFLHKHKEISGRIMSEIEFLQKDPYRGAIPVQGTTFYRIRIGDFRVLYEIDTNEQIIGIVRISRRETAY